MSCGKPLPWATRRERFIELERLLPEAGVDEASELVVREDLQALADLDPDELGSEDETKRWRRIRKMAPTLVDAAREIVVSVVSEAARRSVGL